MQLLYTLHVVVKQEEHLFCPSNRHCFSATQKLPFSNTVTEKKQLIWFKKNLLKVCQVIIVVAQFHSILRYVIFQKDLVLIILKKQEFDRNFCEIKKNYDYRKYIININKNII